jgi:hypothetical protein
MHRPFLVACVCCLICRAGPAQQREFSAIPDAPSATQQSETGPEATNAVQSGVAMFLTLQKKSAVFPDLATARGPLSNWDKCKLAANNSVALSTIGGALLGSAFGQARTSPGGYGQELGGYGKRLGADMARAASYQVFGTCLLASTTHEDPRFYVKKQLDFRGSLKYAPAVNYSGFLGPLAGEALANTYYPPGSRGVGSTLIRYSADVGWRFGGYLLRQYWPLINRKLQLAPE